MRCKISIKPSGSPVNGINYKTNTHDPVNTSFVICSWTRTITHIIVFTLISNRPRLIFHLLLKCCGCFLFNYILITYYLPTVFNFP